MKKKLLELAFGFAWGIIVCAIITMCTSCRSVRYVEVPKVSKEYVYKTDTVQSHDSIYMHDSIMCLVRGDSVFTDRWHTKYIEKLKYVSKVDTLCKTDSITTPVYVEKSESGLHKFIYSFGWASLLTLLALCVMIVLKRKFF